MKLDKIYTDAEFANAVIPVGTRLIFLGYKDGISGEVTLRYKDSDGNFGNVSTAGGSGGGETGSNSASDITIADTGNHFTAGNVEGALQELALSIGQLSDDFSETLSEIEQGLAEI
jgi:hypothetical protein